MRQNFPCSPLRAAAVVCAGALVALMTGGLAAAQPATEEHQLGQQRITLHLHPFLAADEVALLRLVATNQQALELFLTTAGRHSAIAVAPGEGFLRNGQPVASAVAVSNLPDAETARSDARAGCDAKRKRGAQCVTVLEIAPVR